MRGVGIGGEGRAEVQCRRGEVGMKREDTVR